MKVTFNDKIKSLLKEYNRGVLNMQTQNQHGDTLDPENDTYDGSVADTDEAIPGEEGEEHTDKQKDIESLKALRANPDKNFNLFCCRIASLFGNKFIFFTAVTNL